MSLQWMSQAFCRHFPLLPWIAEPTDRTPASEAAMAVVCQTCPVLQECETYAACPDVTSGFWAGEARTPSLLDQDETGAA